MHRSSSRDESGHNGSDLSEIAKLVDQQPTPDRIASKLAKLLNVQRTEVALLRLDGLALNFLHPPELRAAGTIPLSSNAVAARTALTRTSLLSNNFVQIKHASLFETVKLADDHSDTELIETAPIQKLMSVPIERERDRSVLGVVQISRKGFDSGLAGPDFTNKDLKLLEQVAPILARMCFMDPAAASALV